MQPAAEEIEIEPRDFVISWHLIRGLALILLWIALGAAAFGHWSFDWHARDAGSIDGLIHRYYAMLPVAAPNVGAASCVLVWIAFFRADWSDRLLFVAAVGCTATLFLGGIDNALNQLWHVPYTNTTTTGAVAFFGAAALTSRRTFWRLIFTLWAVYGVVMVVAMGFGSLLSALGGVALGFALIEIALFFAERAGVEVIPA